MSDSAAMEAEVAASAGSPVKKVALKEAAKPESNGDSKKAESATNGDAKSPTKESTDDLKTAMQKLAAGKRDLLVQDPNAAVASLAEACELLGKKYGETANECGEAYFYYGKALLELARMEAGVIDNVLDGVPDTDDETESSFVEGPKPTEEESLEIADKVGEAIEENFEELEKKKAELEAKKNGDAKNGDLKNGDAKNGELKNGDHKVQNGDNKVQNGDVKKEEKMDVEDAKSEDVKKENGDTKEVKKEDQKDKKTDSKEDAKMEVEDSKSDAKKAENGVKTDETEKKSKKDSSEEEKEEDSADGAGPSTSKGETSEADKEAENEEEDEEGEEAKENESIGSNEAGPSDDKEATDKSEIEKEEEEDPSNLQLAWEMLELAKTIFTKHADSLEATSETRLELESKLDETYQTLGEVSIENENYPQAIEDLTMCLRRRQELLPEDSRCIAETHYQLGVALGFNAQFDEAVNALSDAIAVLEKRISFLKEGKASKDKSKAKDAFYTAEREVTEIEGIIPEIKEKITDTKDMQAETIKKIGDRRLVEDMIAAKAGAANGDGKIEEKGDVPSSSSGKKAVVNNISSLVKKRKKSGEENADNGESSVKKPHLENGVKKSDAKVTTNGH